MTGTFSSLFGDMRNPANRAAFAALIAAAEADNAAFDIARTAFLAPRTVVAVSYKSQYRARAEARGATTKAAKRGNGDWLQRKLEAMTLRTVIINDHPKQVLDVSTFEAILDANGVAHAHWNRTTPGWQGRLRMSGGLALRSRVARAAFLVGPNHEHIEAPASFCDAYC